jgi:hypothetical protein
MKQQPIIAHKLDENITPTETKSRGEQKPLQSPKLGATTTWRGRCEASLSSKTQPQNPSQNWKKKTGSFSLLEKPPTHFMYELTLVSFEGYWKV